MLFSVLDLCCSWLFFSFLVSGTESSSKALSRYLCHEAESFISCAWPIYKEMLRRMPPSFLYPDQSLKTPTVALPLSFPMMLLSFVQRWIPDFLCTLIRFSPTDVYRFFLLQNVLPRWCIFDHLHSLFHLTDVYRFPRWQSVQRQSCALDHRIMLLLSYRQRGFWSSPPLDDRSSLLSDYHFHKSSVTSSHLWSAIIYFALVQLAILVTTTHNMQLFVSYVACAVKCVLRAFLKRRFFSKK